MDIQDEKRILRRTTLRRRNELTPEARAAAGVAVAARVLALPEIDSAEVVLAFASFGSEIPTDPTIERLLASGRRVLLPFVEGASLRATEIRSLDEVAPGFRGIREPVARDAVDPAGPMLVPGVAFDARGGRCGYGGGFYDTFLDERRDAGAVIGLCFDVQIADEVPVGPGDVRVDAVVTESRTLRAPAR